MSREASRSGLEGADVKYLFANHVLDPERRELWHGSRPVAIEPQVFDLLVHLLENRDRVVSKDDLIASVWGGRIVSDSTLTTRFNAARRAVGDSGEKQKLIRTIPRKGLRFVGTIADPQAAPDAARTTKSTLEQKQGAACRPGHNLPRRTTTFSLIRSTA